MDIFVRSRKATPLRTKSQKARKYRIRVGRSTDIRLLASGVPGRTCYDEVGVRTAGLGGTSDGIGEAA
jgi:hypothetical protein